MLGQITRQIRRGLSSRDADLSTTWGRVRNWFHFQFGDHAFLRVWWRNMDEIAPGVWRSNQPGPARMRLYAKMGIKTVLNLRGESNHSFHLFEVESAEKLGMTIINHPLNARALRSRENYLRLLDTFETIDKPFIMHCKSGADRAGLASALWLLHMEGADLDAARAQLSLKYLHLKSTKTGLLDHFLETYARQSNNGQVPIREWLETTYDQGAIQGSYKARIDWG